MLLTRCKTTCWTTAAKFSPPHHVVMDAKWKQIWTCLDSWRMIRQNLRGLWSFRILLHVTPVHLLHAGKTLEIVLFIIGPMTVTLGRSYHIWGWKIYLQAVMNMPRSTETQSEPLCKAVLRALAMGGKQPINNSARAIQGPQLAISSCNASWVGLVLDPKSFYWAGYL